MHFKKYWKGEIDIEIKKQQQKNPGSGDFFVDMVLGYYTNNNT